MESSRYAIRLTSQSEEDLDRLRVHRDRVVKALQQLEEHPTKEHTLQGQLKGLRSLEYSLPGSGVYRAIYQIQPDKSICLIIIIGPHENIYKKAERRVKTWRQAGEI